MAQAQLAAEYEREYNEAIRLGNEEALAEYAREGEECNRPKTAEEDIFMRTLEEYGIESEWRVVRFYKTDRVHMVTLDIYLPGDNVVVSFRPFNRDYSARCNAARTAVTFCNPRLAKQGAEMLGRGDFAISYMS